MVSTAGFTPSEIAAIAGILLAAAAYVILLTWTLVLAIALGRWLGAERR